MEENNKHTDFEELIRQHAAEDGSIPATAIKTIVTAIRQAIGNEYVDKKRYKSKLDEIDTLREQQLAAEDSAETAKKWKEKYSALKGEFDAYKTEQTQKEIKAAKQSAYRELLKQADVPDQLANTILKALDVNAMELDEHGRLENAEKILDDIKKEWNDYIPHVVKAGAQTETPAVTNEAPKMTRDEIFAMKNPTERQKAILENRGLFGF